MKRLRLWRRMTSDEKAKAAEEALRAAVAARNYWDIDDDDDWLDILPPIEVAGVIMDAVESLLEVPFQWDYVTEGLERLGNGATCYWFRVFDYETGFVLTHNPDKKELSYYKFIESIDDVKCAVIQIADMIAERLPVIRTIYRQFGELLSSARKEA